MPAYIGDTAISASNLGDTALSKIYLGDTEVWPGEGVTVVGTAIYNAATGAMPAHITGDLILVQAFRSGSTTAPTRPAGYVDASYAGTESANTASIVSGSKVAQSNAEATGTWTNATWIAIVVLRGAGALTIGQAGSGTGTTLTYPVLGPTGLISYTPPGTGLQDPGGKSIVIRIAAHRTATNLNANTPAGYTQLAVGTGNAGMRILTSGETATDPTTATQVINASSGWFCSSWEIMCARSLTHSDAFTTSIDTTKWWNDGSTGWTITSNRMQFAGGSGANAAATTRYAAKIGSDLIWRVPTLPATSGVHYYGWGALAGGGFWLPGSLMEGIQIAITSTGGSTTLTAPGCSITGTATRTTAAGNWFRIQKTGAGAYTVYFGTNGTSWTSWVTITGMGIDAGRFFVMGLASTSSTTCSIDDYALT